MCILIYILNGGKEEARRFGEQFGMANVTHCHTRPLAAEECRCAQKVTSVDLGLDGYASSTMDSVRCSPNGNEMVQRCLQLHGSLAGPGGRLLSAGVVAGETEVSAFSVRIRAHYSL